LWHLWGSEFQSCYYPGAAQGCHAVDGNTAPGFYETYDGVKNKINFISKRVLEDKNMPPEYNTEGPTQMGPCDLELLSRWIAEGAKDN